MNQTRRLGRIDGIDTLRGGAVIGMVVFHAAWDLHYLGLTGTDPNRAPLWHGFGHTVAGTFLFVSGFSLVLALRNGVGTGALLRRIGSVALAAFAVTVITGLLMPGRIVLFGILHCIALSDLLALALLRRSPSAIAILAVAAAVIPALLPNLLGHDWWWLGLSDAVPDTIDYRPLLPWLAPVLLGAAAAHRDDAVRLGRTLSGGASLAPVRWLGRHSLAAYLLHQPALFAVLLPMAALVEMAAGPSTGDTTAVYLEQCRAECVAKGAEAGLCSETCRCVAGNVRSGKATDPDTKVASACLASAVTRRPTP